jgi:hypothetical protein
VQICVINQSTRVSDSDVSLMCRACTQQVFQDLAPAWSRSGIPVVLWPAASPVPAGSFGMLVLDTPDVQGALGYHDENGDLPAGKIFVGPVLDNGGVVLYDAKNPENVSVASVLSHEVCELIIDRYVNAWADGPVLPQGQSYALEVADPVEGDSYAVHLSATEIVSVSNFVTPHWFDAQATAGQYFDKLKKLSAPFTMTPGGYMIVRNAPGSEQQVLGEKAPPAWRQDLRAQNARSRLTRRLARK